nr:hypothetical protein [Tanacetum cinerariifolium]
MKMEHYLSHKDYSIWQVIQNKNGHVSVTTDTNGMIKVLPPKTAEEVMARERERKAKTILLIALPEDHLAKFHKMLMQKRCTTTSSSNTHNVAFVSTENTSNTNDVSTAYNVSSSSVLESQKEGSSLYNDEINDDDDMEEIDLKWQVTMIFMRIKKFHKRTGKKLQFDTKDPAGFDKTKVECFNCHKMRHFARDYRAKGNQDSRRRDVGYNGNKTRDNGRRPAYQDDSKALVTINGEDINWCGHVEEDAQNYAMMAYSSSNSGYDNESVFMNKASDLEDTPVNDRFVNGMHAVPLPMTWNYMPSGPDVEIYYSKFTYGLKQTSADESDSKPNEYAFCESDSSVETSTSMPKPVENASKVVCEPKVWIDAPIIEDYESDSDNDSMSNVQEDKEKPSFAFTDSVKHVKTSKENIKETGTTNHSPKIEKQDRNGHTRKGLGYAFTRKACFVCVLLREIEILLLRPQQVLSGDTKEILGTNSPTTSDDPPKALKDKGIVDSGCSRHMTRNKAHLADYQEFKGGSVAFGGSNGRITGKGKIKTGRLDFEDVYYVEELKHYNLFSVSQMFDEKNKVLFTDIDCLVMSPDFKLHDENQAEAVNTACYVLNKVLVTKPQNKTPYELLTGKFDGKSDLGFFVGYSLNSKAYRVYNLETKRVKKNMHVNFLENKPNVARKGHALMFDLDYLTSSMNYEPVSVENQVNKSAGPKKLTIVQELKKLKRQEKEANYAAESLRKEATHDIQNASTSSTNLINTAGTPLSTAGPSRAFNDGELSYLDPSKYALQDDPSTLHLEDTYASQNEGIFTDSYYDDEGVVTDFNNLETTSRSKVNKNSKAHALVSYIQKQQRNNYKDFSIGCLLVSYLKLNPKRYLKHWKIKIGLMLCKRNCYSSKFKRQEEGIDYDEVFAPVARIEAIRIFLAFSSYMGFIVYQIDVKGAFLYGAIDEEVYVSQPHGFVDPKFPNKFYKVVKALYGLHQAPRACVKTASTPIETQKPLVKDEEAADVDVHLYRRLISWQCKKQTIVATSTTEAEYVAVAHCCGQVLWIQNQLLDCGFNFFVVNIRLLIATLVNRRLIEFTMSNTHQELASPEANGFCKELASPKQTALGKDILYPLMAAKPTESKGFNQIIDFLNGSMVSYALTASLTIRISCIKQFWTTKKVKTINDEVRIQALIDEKRVNIKESSIHRTLKLDDAEGTSCLANAEILMCLSAKTTSWNEFSSTMASAIICLATTQKFNFSRYILLSLVKNIKAGVPFFMFLRVEKLEGRVDRLKEENKVLKELHSVHLKVDTAAPVDDDDKEPVEVEKVLAIVIAAKLITEVVTTTGATTAAKATKISVPRRRRGVVIEDPEETTSTVVVHSKQVKRSERLNDVVMKYQALKRKPLTEAQAWKNMIIYLKNMIGFKVNYFKGMTYNEIRPLFEKHYIYDQAFPEEVNEKVTIPEKEVEVECHKREGESLEKEITRKQNIDEEAEEP